MHSFCKLDDDPNQPTKYSDLIINTLIKAQNEGKAKNTVKSISQSLKQLNKHGDLKNPEEVKTYLANNDSICNATKTKLVFAYNWFCQTNNIEWKRPHYKWERKIPPISATENINKINSASTKKYATIFTILETRLKALARAIFSAIYKQPHHSKTTPTQHQTRLPQIAET